MARVTFIEKRCKGCKVCINFCPQKILEIDTRKMNEKGFYAVRVTQEEKCTGCASCAIMCPDSAIEVER